MQVTELIYFLAGGVEKLATTNQTHQMQLIRTDKEYRYLGYCDDFGPMSLGTVFRFCDRLREKLQVGPVAIMTTDLSEDVTNALFLAGAYLIMRLDYDLSAVSARLGKFL